MSAWERSRAVARCLSLALGLVLAGASFGVAFGQPDLGSVLGEERGPAQASAPVREASLALPLPDVQSPAPRLEPFGLPAPANGATSLAAKWRHISAAVDLDRNILARCRIEPHGCPPAALRFLALVEAALEKPGRARLGEINRSLNLAIRYQSDLIQHGASDAWASPLATLAAGQGDCEDYAIAKYLALREAGMPSGDLRLVVVRDAKRNELHAILAARLEDRWLVLDNRRLLLLEDADIGDYTPVIAFGAEPEPQPFAADSRPAIQDGAPALAADAVPSPSSPS
jgi:predicted transglutaminase-like cysteine proteinase